MKKLIAAIIALISLPLLASNYPPDYCHQKVYTWLQGPIQISMVSAGCSSEYLVLGYRPGNGYLNQFNAEKLTAVVKIYAANGLAKQSTIDLGREWNGNGYVSYAHRYYDLSPTYNSRNTYFCVAVSDNQGHWDSKYSQNYCIDLRERAMDIFNSNENPGYRGLNYTAWNHIIDLMSQGWY